MRLSEKYDLRQVIPSTHKRRNYGAYVLDCCPFHDDSSPSFLIWPDRFECKAGCGSGGIVEWTVRTQGCTKDEAIRQLRQGLPDYIEPVKRVEPKKEVGELDQSLALRYHLQLGEGERHYFYNRGLTDESINRWELGYGTPPSGGAERFSIPIRDIKGLLVNVRFRRDDRCPECGALDTREIDKSTHLFQCDYCEHQWRAHPAKFIGIPGANDARLFNVGCLKDASSVFICEGEMDAIRLSQEGYNAVSGTSGAPTFPASWAVLFLHTSRVYTVYDNDEAGKSGSKSVVEVIPKCRVIELPDGIKDVTDYFANHNREEFEELIQQADRRPENSLLLKVSSGLMRSVHSFAS